MKEGINGILVELNRGLAARDLSTEARRKSAAQIATVLHLLRPMIEKRIKFFMTDSYAIRHCDGMTFTAVGEKMMVTRHDEKRRCVETVKVPIIGAELGPPTGLVRRLNS
jgi:hypothetical protein